MKSIYSKLVLISLLLITASAPISAREYVGSKKVNTKKAAVQSKAAVCKRAQSTAELNINNVRALINGYGNMWYDGSVAKYHLPKNSNTCPLFCAALWIGGTDVNDQLRIAALRFGTDGDDYWPGPLKINGTASVDLPVCNNYDKHFIITKAEVLAHKAHFEYDENGATGDNPDIPDIIRKWPAHGVGDDLSPYLAPFFDANHNNIYEPELGDYPYYDFENDLCPRTLKAEWGSKYTEHVAPTIETTKGIVKGGLLSDQVLKGDQTIWWVFNDKGNTHTESKGEAIGLEIRAQAFAFSTNDEINNMTFYSYEIINRSSYELRETYFSQWVDPDLGYAWDDFVGCDVRRGLGYCYNGKPQDTPGSGSYSGLPPAVGIDFFQGPYMDADGLDNPKIDIPKILSDSYTNLQVKNLLQNYRQVDTAGNVYYDTISITDDADLFFTLDPASWYFVPGDAVGNCAINGVNFGNNIIDDERFGMRRFVYYDNSGDAIYGEPTKASDYYNYLRGYWKNGQRMKYGGNAVSNGVDPAKIDCDFMFPDDSDPWHWGTDGIIPTTNPTDWREITAGNSPGDRRFMQSAGPFTLKPGALNYITVGIPFAQASSGDGQWASVTALRSIDDVCQALFENCFKVLDGPDAPTMTCQELNNEIILYLSYEDRSSNNFNEKYREIDPAIPRSYADDRGETHLYDSVARSYIFEGYQIYQLKDANTSVADIYDESKAKLVAQCDIKNFYDTLIITSSLALNANHDTITIYDTTPNGSPSLPISRLVNYTTNTATGLITGQVMVDGANEGIQHVFRITTDAFATGTNTQLVNNKEYYFIAVAYAQNRFKEYSQTDAAFLDGQKEPYLAGRKNEKGHGIEPITAIPHNPAVENGGKIAQAEFGMCPNIIRIEGFGNGTSSGLRMTEASIAELMGAPGVEGKGPGTYVENYFTPAGGARGDYSYMNSPCIVAHPEYEENYGPINVRVIDPFKLREGSFNIMFWNMAVNASGDTINNDTLGVNKKTRWCIVNADPTKPVYISGTDTVYKVWSHFAISRYNEQIFPELGIAVSLLNPEPAATNIDISGYTTSSGTRQPNYFAGGFYQGFVNEGALLGSSMTFADETKQWLYGVPDDDSYLIYNWIRSGSQFSPNAYGSFISPTTQYDVNEMYLDEDYFKAFVKEQGSMTSSVDSSEGIDKTQLYEDVVGGLWAPYGVVSTMPFHPGFSFAPFISEEDHIRDSISSISGIANRYQLERLLLANVYNKALNYNELAKLPSVHIVITADKTKWTRCPVVEMCDDHTQSEGNVRRFMRRAHASVDKDGKTCADLGINANANDPNNPAYIDSIGMGWFPGYAINTVTGERLNIMFGEDSRYVQFNGRDMKWNPVSTTMEGTQNYVMGGRHFIYVMNATRQTFYDLQDAANTNLNKYFTYVTPSYDGGRWAIKMLKSAEHMMNFSTRGNRMIYKGIVNRVDNYNAIRDSIALLYASTAWVNMPLVNTRYQFDDPKDMPCDVTINIDIRTPYNKNMTFNGTTAVQAGNAAVNRNMPAYQFIINASDAVLENQATAEDARKSYVDSLLSLINVVPNPYYSYSNYETASQLETKVRIINLPTGINKNGKPEGCYIRIYTADGTLVRTLGPTATSRTTDPHAAGVAENTTVDWDLHNQSGIPIAGGMYLIHVTVPGIGERVIKWFGTMRPVDLNSFGF